MKVSLKVFLVLHSFTQTRSVRQFLRCALASVLIVIFAVPLQERSSSAWAQPTPPKVASEYNLKLARLYATSKFIAWPDETNGTNTPFVIGVIDPDPFQGGLQKLTTRKIKDRPIRVLILKSEEDYESCHLLFIPAEARPEIVAAILKRAANQPVLVWRDQASPDGAVGIACTFVREGDSLLIEADPAELKRRKLVPDGQLLSLNLVRIRK